MQVYGLTETYGHITQCLWRGHQHQPVECAGAQHVCQRVVDGSVRRPGERGDPFAATRGVARIGDHGQVRAIPEDRDRRHVERVPGGGLERPDPALAQHHAFVAGVGHGDGAVRRPPVAPEGPQRVGAGSPGATTDAFGPSGTA